LANEISIGFIWVDRNNEWQIPEDWEPHYNEDPVSENLNEVAESYDDNQDLESIVKKSASQPDFLQNPEFDTTFLSLMFNETAKASANSLQFFSPEWMKLAKKLKSKNLNPSVVAVPHNMSPWEWYELSEEEMLSEMGLSESETLRADGVLFTEFNSFYFDTYRFGSISFNLTKNMTLEEIASNSEFVNYCQEIFDSGPDSENHRTCDDNCAFRPCSRIEIFPASISGDF
jgi:hypothetical protein